MKYICSISLSCLLSEVLVFFIFLSLCYKTEQNLCQCIWYIKLKIVFYFFFCGMTEQNDCQILLIKLKIVFLFSIRIKRLLAVYLI